MAGPAPLPAALLPVPRRYLPRGPGGRARRKAASCPPRLCYAGAGRLPGPRVSAGPGLGIPLLARGEKHRQSAGLQGLPAVSCLRFFCCSNLSLYFSFEPGRALPPHSCSCWSCSSYLALPLIFVSKVTCSRQLSGHLQVAEETLLLLSFQG